MKKQILTIAGSDSGGGAGVQADIKTITAHNCYALSVITALTAQNTQGVDAIFPVSPEFISQQLEAVFSDFEIDAVKIGMIQQAEIVVEIARTLKKYQPRYTVLDPVMVATSGDSLIDSDAIQAIKEELFPLATIVTPNRSEGRALSGKNIDSTADFAEAAAGIKEQCAGHVLLKGGDLPGRYSADLLLTNGGESFWLREERVDTKNAHGTGCTLSSAIACNLGLGKPIVDACRSAKTYLTHALIAHRFMAPGKGRGPVDHTWFLKHGPSGHLLEMEK